MVVVRFQRLGTKKIPHHRIVVAERTRAQAGLVLEVVGYYDPSRQPPLCQIKQERIAYWVSRGAQVSEALAHLLRRTSKSAARAA